VTTSQRVAVTVGIPLLGVVMIVRADLLAGIHLALASDVLLTLMAVILIRAGLRWRTPPFVDRSDKEDRSRPERASERGREGRPGEANSIIAAYQCKNGRELC
jgi:hypothetical protein